MPSPLAIALAALLLAPAAPRSPQDEAFVVRAALEGDAVSPGTERYVLRALREAEERRAEAFVLVLDTPGGLLDSTRTLVQRFLASDVPVVVHVAPRGARAASAGTFLTMAAHVAAMAPGTTIGAAHPVSVGGLPLPRDEGDGEEPPGGATAAKVVNDTVSWARSIADSRGRNADWAERAVRESLSVGASEALEAGAIDLVAQDLGELLAAVDGREVEVASGARVLRTRGARVEEIGMWWGEQLLALIASPDVAFLLLLFGFYGILFEITSPGFGVPGVLGVICLALAMFGLAMLPVSWLGLGLVVVALGLFVAEVLVTSYGLLGIAGAACLVLGGLMLVDSPEGFERVSWVVLVPSAVATALICTFLISKVVGAQRRPALGGSEGLLAERARALGAFEPQDGGYGGNVLVHGERWRATSPEPVSAGATLAVRGREGLVLRVEPQEGSRADDR